MNDTGMIRRIGGLFLVSVALVVAGCATADPGGNANTNTNTNGNGGGTGGTVSLTGRLTVTETAIIDGDTNDPLNATVANNADDLTQVQSLPNPASVGGFLGNIQGTADAYDVYRVQMAAGQSAALLLADPTANDFDLFLYDENADAVDSSEGVGRAEQVVAPDNGTYFVEIYGFSVDINGDAGGLYTLLVGRSAATAAMAPAEKLSSLYPHREDEVIVRYKKGSARAKRTSGTENFDLEVISPASNATRLELVRTKRRAHTDIGARKSAKSTVVRKNTSALRRPSSDVVATIKQLRRQGDVELAEPNYLRFAMTEPNDEFYGLQWHYPQISLPDAWDITTGDASVIVAVIDTGVVLNHPDLQGQLVNGYDFISDPNMSLDGDGIDASANDPGDLAIQGTKSSFHGTHVSGTIAAASNNGTGVAGIAWDAKIMPVRVLGNGGGTEFDIVQGILFAAGQANASGTLPAQPADVINMSLGGQGISTSEQEAVDAARAAGVIVIAAAGNDASNADGYTPAGLDGVVTVSAVGYTRDLAPYSNFGDSVDVAAPGGDTSVDANGDTYPDGVLSSMATDEGDFVYDFSQGTSMACPHVAGVTALMKSVNANLSPDDFDQLLAGTHPGTTISITDDLGSAGKDTSYGHGLINALGAVRAAADIAGVEAVAVPVLRALPRSVDFGSNQTSADITISNGGSDTLSVTSASASETWLAVSPGSGGEGTYEVTVDRSGLADGAYAGTVSFASNGGSADVPVRMSVGTQNASGGDIGTIYVLVLDLEVGASVDQYNATADGGYAFSFSGLQAGEYGLFAGTDMDNDSFIDNEGEALGGHPTLFEADTVDLTEDRSGLEFNVTYLINVQTPSAANAATATEDEAPRDTRLRLQRIR